jgi:hypothetical protein
MADATPDAGFGCADLTLFCRLDELGLEGLFDFQRGSRRS